MFASDLTIGALLHSSLYIPNLVARGRIHALTKMVDSLVLDGDLDDGPLLLRLLLERERLGTTAIGHGVAIPHARPIGLATPCLALARSDRGIDWGAPDGVKVQIIFLLVVPDSQFWRDRYLEFLAQLAQWAQDGGIRQRLLQAADFESIRGVFSKSEHA